MIRGLAVTLGMIRKEGIENVWARTAMLAKATRAAAHAVGMPVFAKDPSDSVTGLVVPPGIDEPSLRKKLKGDYGFHVAAGQDHLKGKVIRISHMGYVDVADTIGMIGALELVLAEMGHQFTLGEGLRAALTVFAKRA
jgi:aspartate aminotransferase-like enzyme